MMMEDNQIVPLAPSKINPRSDEEFAAVIKPNKYSHQRKSSKCLVYFLATIVIASTLALLFALIVLRPSKPDIQMSSIQVTNLTYSTGNITGNINGTLPSFNMTFEGILEVENSNFGEFKYANGTLAALYRGFRVGEVIRREGRVSSRDSTRTNFRVQVRSQKVLDSLDLKREIDSGLLRMSFHSKFDGKVHLLRIISKRKSTTMVCTFLVDLNGGSIKNLIC